MRSDGFYGMHYEVEVNGRLRKVDVTRTGDGFAVEVDGHRRNVDAARIDAHTLSLLIGDMWPEGDSRPDLRRALRELRGGDFAPVRVRRP